MAAGRAVSASNVRALRHCAGGRSHPPYAQALAALQKASIPSGDAIAEVLEVRARAPRARPRPPDLALS